MALPFTVDDVGFLTCPAGRDVLEAAAALPLAGASQLADLTRLRDVAGDRAGVVAETVLLRRRAVGKLGPGAAGWLFTDEALQQATPAEVATHRARRLTGVGVHDLTCSIGADLSALAGSGIAVGSDRDPVRVHMARHNLLVAGRPARLAVADALTRTSRGLLGYADPARRDGAGRRITSVSTIPSVVDLDAAYPERPPVLRLPPGIDYDALGRPGEVEIVSLDGGAREAVLWPPEMGEVARRATVLVSAGRARAAGAGGPVSGEMGFRDMGFGEMGVEGMGFEVTSDDPDDVAVGPVGEYLIDPDAAVVRAHLVRHYAARHGLWLLDPQVAYLTGSAVPAGVRGFRVLDQAPYRERVVAGWARRDRIGTLEIKQRGTPLIPDDLRRRLRPSLIGPTTAAATLIVARVGTGKSAVPQAFWCRAAEPGRLL